MEMADPLARALDAARRGRFDEARQLCQEILSTQPDSHPALYLMGAIAAQAGRFEEAHSCFEKATLLHPGASTYLVNLGNVCRILGRPEEAARAFAEALKHEPDNLAASKGLAFSTMPGDAYETLLGRFHEWLRPAVYLEIGVETGRTLALARPPTRAFGVDPNPKIQVSFETETSVFEETSDGFFADHDVAAETGPLDMAFLDGLHLFEQTLRDFINVEHHVATGAVVFVHDCLPLNRRTAQRERQGDFWTGDPWKIIPVLRRYRPELEVFVIASAPTGLGVVTGMNPESRVLEEAWDEILAEFVSLELDEENRDKQLAVVANDWDTICARIDAARSSVS